MPRESLRHAIPSSYDEEMEQLRIALEISARASTSHDVHASSSARNSLRQSAAPHVTTSPRCVNGSGASTRTAGRTGRVLVDDARARRPARARDDFADDDDDARATLAERLDQQEETARMFADMQHAQLEMAAEIAALRIALENSRSA